MHLRFFPSPRVRAFVFRAACLALAALPGAVALAYPPAPHHTIYGVVRDDMGHPLVVTNAQVVLETLSGVQIKKQIVPHLAPGVNYRLFVPMDAGLTDDAYHPTALRPTLPFRMKVIIGTVTHLPIEMTVDFASLGQPSQTTRIDLTLGIDSDKDSLPDAWERSVLGEGMDITDISPHEDLDGDGVSNFHEYIAGTYAFDSEDGLKVQITSTNNRPCVEFLAITGRSYTLHASSDMKSWAPVPFRVSGDTSAVPTQTSYRATDVRTVRLEVIVDETQPPPALFLRAKVE
jgi:hypothetical protein